MAPITALLNSNVTDDKGIQVFYVTDQQNLAVALKNSAKTGQDSQDVFASGKDAQTGFIPVNSEIGTATLEGLNLVVAVTKHKPASASEVPTLNDVSIVSPVYQVLDTTSVSNTTVAISSNTDNSNAWVYYLKGTDAGNIQISEYEVTTGNIGTADNLNINPDCSLGAYFDGSTNQRSVIYQDNAQGHLKEYNVDSGQTTDISDSAGARPNTGLAVAYFEGHVYLFYTDSFLNLYLVVKDNRGAWGGHRKITPGTNPDASSQLTAVGANGTVHLFYQAKGNKNITHYREKAAAA